MGDENYGLAMALFVTHNWEMGCAYRVFKRDEGLTVKETFQRLYGANWTISLCGSYKTKAAAMRAKKEMEES